MIGGGDETLALLRMASLRSDDVCLIVERMDETVRRFAELFALEFRVGVAFDHDMAGVNALLVAVGDKSRENAAVRAARRRGIPVHVAGRPLVSDFTLLDLVTREPASFPRSAGSHREAQVSPAQGAYTVP